MKNKMLKIMFVMITATALIHNIAIGQTTGNVVTNQVVGLTPVYVDNTLSYNSRAVSRRPLASLDAPIVADLNNDNIKEIIIATGDINKDMNGGIEVWNYDLTKKWSVDPEPNIVSQAHGIAVGDINNDRFSEVVAIVRIKTDDRPGYKDKIYAYDFEGKLLPGFPCPASLNTGAFSFLTLADVDQNGTLDIVATLDNYTDIYYPVQAWYPMLIAFDFAGNELRRVSAPYSSTSTQVLLAAGDVDNNGSVEIGYSRVQGPLFLANPYPDPSVIFLLKSDGSRMLSTSLERDFRNTTPIVMGDIDKNGDLEIALLAVDPMTSTREPDAVWKIFLYHHTGELMKSFVVPPDTSTPLLLPKELTLADLDGDGDLEILRGKEAYHHSGLAVAGWPLNCGEVVSEPLILDIDNDKKPEVLLAETLVLGIPGREPVKKYYMKAWNNDGSSVPDFSLPIGEPQTTLPDGTIFKETINGIVAADLENDGIIDIVELSAYPDQLHLKVISPNNTVTTNINKGEQWTMFRRNPKRTGNYPRNICEGNFDGDFDVDGTDAIAFQKYFRTYDVRGDFDNDGNVDGTDVAIFKEDYGRSKAINPCPKCINCQ